MDKRRRTLTMNWEELEDDEDDNFFEPRERFSSAVPQDLASSESDDNEDFDDSRLSFSSAVSSTPIIHSKNSKGLDYDETVRTTSSNVLGDYDVWMAEPGDLKERRRRLLEGMGLLSNKSLHKIASAKKFARAISRKAEASVAAKHSTSKTNSTRQQYHQPPRPRKPYHSPPLPNVLVRPRSAGDMESLYADTKKRKEELLSPVAKQQLTRTLSSLTILANTATNNHNLQTKTTSSSPPPPRKVRNSGNVDSLDTSNDEFISKNSNSDGTWNKLQDIQTGKHLESGGDELDKSPGYSPVVKEVMHRENNNNNYSDKKLHLFSRSVRYSKRRGVAILKNINKVAHSMSSKITDKDLNSPREQQKSTNNKNSSQWIKVRHHGKPYKEFTGLHLCQEIHAHEGSIWCIKFSSDAHYLASAGEDKVIHIWEVQECDVMAGRPYDDLSSVGGMPVHPAVACAPSSSSASASPVHPMANNSSCGASPVHPMVVGKSENYGLGEFGAVVQTEKKKKGRSFGKKKAGNAIPEYVNVPETVFALSEKPVCTLVGHQDVVLDLSWSTSQLLLSSSMDKTVRLWDVETQSCLKMFAHNDYVTCIQFNPVNDDYFISGSLDSKVRIWNVTDRMVVDWTDLKEMVTATSYTPDGNGAIIGSHRGSCRFYSTTDCKLVQQDQFDTQNKKKSQIRKVTGFQYSPSNPSELLISTGDSRIRIHDGSSFTHKFKGFRNTSSQISASFSPDGKHVISASEDSQVYIWKREEPKSTSGKGKSRVIINAHEHFPCKDVSVAIPWPGSTRNEPPMVELHSKRHSKRFLPPQFPAIGSPSRDEIMLNSMSKRQSLPPLPKSATSCQESEFSRADSGVDDTIRFGDSPSISASISSSPSHSWSQRFDGGSHHGSNAIQATAWGLVIVTASLGGEIRVYQNFGLPVKVSRQSNLFKDLT